MVLFDDQGTCKPCCSVWMIRCKELIHFILRKRTMRFFMKTCWVWRHGDLSAIDSLIRSHFTWWSHAIVVALYFVRLTWRWRW
jgi:hypothetical protein